MAQHDGAGVVDRRVVDHDALPLAEILTTDAVQGGVDKRPVVVGGDHDRHDRLRRRDRPGRLRGGRRGDRQRHRRVEVGDQLRVGVGALSPMTETECGAGSTKSRTESGLDGRGDHAPEGASEWKQTPGDRPSEPLHDATRRS